MQVVALERVFSGTSGKAYNGQGTKHKNRVLLVWSKMNIFTSALVAVAAP
jgi:hypothetical protein